MINKVDICGVNTSKLPVLSEAQKQELFSKIQRLSHFFTPHSDTYNV